MQSSVSLQHLPFDTAVEAATLDSDLIGRLSFAKQKLGEIVNAATAKPSTDTGAPVTKLGAPLLVLGASTLWACVYL